MFNRVRWMLALMILLSPASARGAESNGDLRFLKTKLFFMDASRTSPNEPGQDRLIEFERKRALFGAITPSDQRERYGNYFTFQWESLRPADVTVRLEYRQANLGPTLQTKLAQYPGVTGKQTTRFQVTGDDFLQYGRVIAWRAVLIANGKIVAQSRSYLWRDK